MLGVFERHDHMCRCIVMQQTSLETASQGDRALSTMRLSEWAPYSAIMFLWFSRLENGCLATQNGLSCFGINERYRM